MPPGEWLATSNALSRRAFHRKGAVSKAMQSSIMSVSRLDKARCLPISVRMPSMKSVWMQISLMLPLPLWSMPVPNEVHGEPSDNRRPAGDEECEVDPFAEALWPAYR
ncbi:hypothetical protein Saro_3006 [Novosphingobium aromaticivorans DSM 12444]|uniref:Uncharacterized protein n=1 Tax=Novosphingobium aromaticivorans (strain ATCC 700278 / DSM 12444 / CCUG 56034 / CIP 105152 / NBRC 16084 / F199) TaxID=279238 RepID=Q2G3Y2_NOVAD|nr:hypothetical protein Saro_3006 [Novosphingobium aromaticivorans DSM 12444]